MKKRTGFNWFALIMFVVIAYFGHVGKNQRIADKRLAAAQAENEKLRKQYEELQNLDNIERLAREDLGLAREGELPYQPAR